VKSEECGARSVGRGVWDEEGEARRGRRERVDAGGAVARGRGPSDAGTAPNHIVTIGARGRMMDVDAMMRWLTWD
jgi:hypothetical protein